MRYFDIELDFLPDRYYNDPKRTWRNASILMGCFIGTMIVLYSLGLR